MQIELNPELSRKVEAWQARSGRPVIEIIEDALAGYMGDLDALNSELDCRFKEIESGAVELLDGAATMREMMLKADEEAHTLL